MTVLHQWRHGSLPTPATAAAIAGIIARDTALPTLDAVLDPVERRGAVADVSLITRLRYKPGSSIVAALAHPSATGVTGTSWIAAYADPAKAGKTLARARRSGFSARPVEGIPGVLVGETCADRTLSLPLATIRSREPELFAAATVLRHNPHRRVVFRSALRGIAVLLKVSAEDGAAGPDGAHRSGPIGSTAARQSALNTLERGGIAVLRPGALHGLPGVETVPWWGRGDLAAIPDPYAARTAGQHLAVLHNAPPADFLQLAGAVDHTIAAREAAQVIATLLPGLADHAAHLAATLGRIAEALPPRRRTLVHGDFSPDQVLVGRGEVRLIDFDRAGIDCAERDLGSFAASAELLGRPELTRELITGYTGADAPIDETRLHYFTALALMQRSVEPFRTHTRDWAASTTRILDLVEREAALC